MEDTIRLVGPYGAAIVAVFITLWRTGKRERARWELDRKRDTYVNCLAAFRRYGFAKRDGKDKAEITAAENDLGRAIIEMRFHASTSPLAIAFDTYWYVLDNPKQRDFNDHFATATQELLEACLRDIDLISEEDLKYSDIRIGGVI